MKKYIDVDKVKGLLESESRGKADHLILEQIEEMCWEGDLMTMVLYIGMENRAEYEKMEFKLQKLVNIGKNKAYTQDLIKVFVEDEGECVLVEKVALSCLLEAEKLKDFNKWHVAYLDSYCAEKSWKEFNER